MSMKVCDIGIRLKILRKEGQKGKGVGEEEEEEREVRDEERNMCTGTRSWRQKRGRRGKWEGDGERRGEKMERGKGRRKIITIQLMMTTHYIIT